MVVRLQSDPKRINVARALDKVVVPPLPESNDPSFFQTLGAAVAENIMVAPFIYGLPAANDIEAGFNMFETVDANQEFDPEENPYIHLPGNMWQFADQFIGVFNRKSMTQRTRAVQISQHNREVLAGSGFTGWAATMILGNADPLLFIPGGILITSARGIRAAKTAATFSTVAAAAVAVQEATLQTLDPLRTKGESAFAIGGAAILGGLFGAGFAKLTKAQVKKFAEELAVLPPDVAGRRPTYFGLAGGKDDPLAPGGTLVAPPAAGSLVDPEDLVPELAPSAGVARFSKWIGPTLQLFTSKSASVRVTVNALLQAPMKLARGVINVAPVQAAIKAFWEVRLSRIEEAKKSLYVQYMSGGQREKPSLLEIGFGFRKRDGVMSFAEFDEQVSFATRRIGTSQFDEFPVQVQKAAMRIRGELIEPIANLGVQLGVWTKADVANPAFLSRMYNQDLLRISAERKGMAQAVAQFWVRQAEAKGETMGLKGALKRANEAIDDITSIPIGRSMPDDIGSRGSLLARTLDVPDEVIERWLVNRNGDVMRRYIRTVASDLEIIRKFGLWRARPDFEARRVDLLDRIKKAKNSTEAGEILQAANKELGTKWGGPALGRNIQRGTEKLVRAIRTAKTAQDRLAAMTAWEDDLILRFNQADMRLQIDQIVEEYKVKAREAGLVESEIATLDDLADDVRAARKAESKLIRQADRDLTNLRHMRDDLRGMNTLGGDPTSTAAHVFRNARAVTYLTFGGSIALSQIPDMAMLMNFFGMDNVLRGQFSRFGSDMLTAKLAKEEVRDLLGANELLTNARAQQLFDVQNEFASGSALEQGLDKAVHVFSIVSLISPMNQGLKDLIAYTTVMYVARISRKVKSGKALGKIDRERIGELGLNDAALIRIADQYEAHAFRDEAGKIVDLVPRIDSWDDQTAAGLFRISAQQARDKVLIYGGTGDRPRIPGLGGEVSRTILMFRNFSLGAATRLFGRLAQTRDYRLITHILNGTAFGMLAIYLKAISAGREPPQDLATWMQQGFEQSGLAGVIFDIDDIIENLSKGKIGISALTGTSTRRRFYSGNQLWGSIVGPVGDIALDAVVLPFELLDDDVTPADIGKIRRLIPLQNFIWTRRLWDSLEERAARAVE